MGAQDAPGEAENGTAAFTLRMPKELRRRLDAHLKGKPIKTDRQFFILQAVVEKLEREAG